MRAKALLGILLIICTFSFGQDIDEVEVEIEEEIEEVAANEIIVFITVATDLYPKTYPAPHDNGYWSEDGKAFLKATYRSNSYTDFKEYINTEISGIKTIESKEIELGGLQFMYKKMEQDRAGELVEIVSYIKKNNETSVLEVGGFFPKGTESTYKSAIENAAISAKLIKE
ncbi:hypothetical protein G5B37_12020 [Rasiella rasia]|uniref:Uncharacterized protein n=1 Tax=Rasiella rasia TaxID=2744027 RepID=A0A6G6GNX9_9FLAO|nr:hypothetical protein [Rasiella rasia]QIE60262.1 hypothetical protein G5B37_12020 [Rasiella rasia]